VLYDSAFWKKTVNFQHLAEARMINQADLDLFGFADNPQEAWAELLRRGLVVPKE
jgi:hypothetical protein